MGIKLSNIFTLTLTLFAIIDVLGSLPVILDIKHKVGNIHPLKITLISGGIMLSFMFVGNNILKLMAVDIQSFSLAGALIIFFLGLEMVLNREFFKSNDKSSGSGNVVPIAFPILAGAGTLTTLLSLKAAYNDFEIVIAIFINLIFIYVVLNMLDFISKMLGASGVAVLRKVFGVILLALAIKLFKSNILI
jgi:multiple antibiotic resistance protein